MRRWTWSVGVGCQHCVADSFVAGPVVAAVAVAADAGGFVHSSSSAAAVGPPGAPTGAGSVGLVAWGWRCGLRCYGSDQ